MVMRTMRGVAARRVPGTWWYKVGTLGVALVLPGGLLLLLYLMTRCRTHAAAPVRDPYVEWLRMRDGRSEEHTSELQSQSNLVCRLLLEKKKKQQILTNAPPQSQITHNSYSLHPLALLQHRP